MELFHTSPEKIISINNHGLFGDFLCFAASPYFMTQADSPIVYRIELSDDDVVDAASFFYRDDYAMLDGVVAKVMAMVGCDEDAAQDLLSGKTSLLEVADEFDPEQDFEIQRLQGEAARALGFRAVEVEDEQGAMWLVAMSGFECELEEVEA